MLRQLASRFMNGGGRSRGGRAPRGRAGGRHGSTGARIGSMVERFVRRRR